MVQFAHLMKEITKNQNIREFSLINNTGQALYSSHTEEIKKNNDNLINESQKADYITSKPDSIGKIMPVKTTDYCIGCHAGWKKDEINSYFYVAINNSSLKNITSIGDKTKIFFLVAAIFLIFFVGLIIYFTLGKPLRQFRKGAEEVLNGNYTFRFNAGGRDEMSDVAKMFNKLIETMGINMVSISSETEKVISQSSALTDLTSLIRDQVQEQLLASEQIMKEIQRLSHVKDSCDTLNQQSHLSTQKIKEGQNTINNSIHSVKDMQNSINEIQSSIKGLADYSKEIKNISEIIRNIAGQTNLLALNATIESARAGEAGKGFAVVANEIKDLSKRTGEATQQIEDLVVKIETEVEKNIDISTSGQDKASLSSDQMSLLESFLNFMLEESDKTNGMVTEIGDDTSIALKVLDEQAAKSYKFSQTLNEKMLVLDDSIQIMEDVAKHLENEVGELKKMLKV